MTTDEPSNSSAQNQIHTGDINANGEVKIQVITKYKEKEEVKAIPIPYIENKKKKYGKENIKTAEFVSLLSGLISLSTYFIGTSFIRPFLSALHIPSNFAMDIFLWFFNLGLILLIIGFILNRMLAYF